MRLALACMMAAAGVCAAARLCNAQEIHIYSEFERFDPFGNPVGSDRDAEPREILSPAVARNGHLSLHVVITGPAGSNYLLYTGTNPPGILHVKLYREYFTPCGDDFCPDWLTEQASPTFGAIPEFRHDLARPAMDRQTTRCYLLDIWAPADTPPRRVRVEALLKTGIWQVAPLEVRIMAPILAATAPGAEVVQAEDVAPLEAPSSATARIQLFRYLAGLPAELPHRYCVSATRFSAMPRRTCSSRSLCMPRRSRTSISFPGGPLFILARARNGISKFAISCTGLTPRTSLRLFRRYWYKRTPNSQKVYQGHYTARTFRGKNEV